ncbi:hypothetical protein [Alteromonas sp. 14N.309.X.WAT.G.H12]|uniref:hypothetical protein n=1 Tax=Alteromonas sp. 14N.309.X.WAT.G.H12 TaxID=3120824 RepID=UPI002FD1651C
MKKLVQYVMLVSTMGVSSLAVAEEFNVNGKPHGSNPSFELNKKERQHVDLTSALPFMSAQEAQQLNTDSNAQVNKPGLFKSLPEPVMTAKS